MRRLRSHACKAEVFAPVSSLALIAAMPRPGKDTHSRQPSICLSVSPEPTEHLARVNCRWFAASSSVNHDALNCELRRPRRPQRCPERLFQPRHGVTIPGRAIQHPTGETQHARKQDARFRHRSRSRSWRRHRRGTRQRRPRRGNWSCRGRSTRCRLEPTPDVTTTRRDHPRS